MTTIAKAINAKQAELTQVMTGSAETSCGSVKRVFLKQTVPLLRLYPSKRCNSLKSLSARYRLLV